MLYSWVSFWFCYLMGGCFLYNDSVKMLENHHVTTKELLNTLGVNAFITFLFIPIANSIPTIIYVPNTLYGYIMRIIMALIIGDLCFYWTHRLFHHHRFYFLHKKHHLYVKPNALAGLYCSPIEMLISNHLSMVIPLKIISCYSDEMLMIESGIVALNILKSHSGYDMLCGTHHSKHHELLNCNFGFSYITDYVFGTYR